MHVSIYWPKIGVVVVVSALYAVNVLISKNASAADVAPLSSACCPPVGKLNAWMSGTIACGAFHALGWLLTWLTSDVIYGWPILLPMKLTTSAVEYIPPNFIIAWVID
jgi:hypothetical protein